MTALARPDLLRRRESHGPARVTNVELFFDLVFVFAVTQLSHALLHDLTAGGALRTGFLFLAVWWVWIYTSWVTNWLDPERAPVRLMLFAMMLAGLVLSTSIPEAFEAKGLAFAAAYALMQVGRTGFTLWAIGPGHPELVRNFQRILTWLALAAAFWIAGGVAEGGLRSLLWVIALGIEYVSPALGFRVPGLGRSTTGDWQVEGAHLAERCALFIIIALGESILVTGASFADMAWSGPTLAAFLVAFAGSVAMWWIYFDTGAERGTRRIAGSADPGRMARLGYTYLHLLIVGGIIADAVAAELILAHPGEHAAAEAVAVILGGPALYLLGNALFKASFNQARPGWPPLSHLVGLGLLALMAVVAAQAASRLALGAATAGILVLVAIWERLSLGSRQVTV
ncbi:MAG: low temperature requirement protein A [Acetobacteraceae bacterium]|nr:low temperature requirement protein A [Acetobacteraceae bacterium]